MRHKAPSAYERWSAFAAIGVATAGAAAQSVVPFGGDLVLGGGSQTNIEIAGGAIGEFDRFEVAGDVRLGGSLDVIELDALTLLSGHTFEIIDVGGSLTGIFSGLAEGSRVATFDGIDLFITYAAGDGNNVALFSEFVGTSDAVTVAFFGGDVVFGASSALRVDLLAPGIGNFDRFEIAGDVALNGTIEVVPLDGFVPRQGQSYEFIDTGGTLTGEFIGLPEGSLVTTLEGVDLFITYQADDGNDVALVTSDGDPGSGDDETVIDFAGDVVFGPGSVLVITIDGPALDTYDRIVVHGDVRVDGALAVDLTPGFVPQPGTIFEIIDIGGDLSGVFVGLPEGRGIDIGEQTALFVSYAGGDGNDITLEARPIPSGDINIDGTVDIADLLLVVAGIENENDIFDFDESHDVNFIDLIYYLRLHDAQYTP